jgi:methionyl-tRNA formyltransferase
VTRLVFAGTPDFALASLRALVEAGQVPIAALTQPDRPAGRGKKLTASPVKRYALERGIPVLQPESLRDEAAASELAALEPDLLVVAAYGLILPQNVLDIPTHGCLNVHASVLPRWRGAAPIQAAILAGDEVTGVSLMSMTAGLDCGPVFHVEKALIHERETAGELHDRLAALGGEVLVAKLDAIIAGDIPAEEQDDSLATYAPKIAKDDARIDWSLSADEVARRIRAYNPFPGAFCFVGETRIKIWRASLIDGAGDPGTILHYDRDAIVVGCGAGALSLEELQLPGKRRAPAHEFVGQLDLEGQQLR